MTGTPRVSVIVAAYNCAGFVHRAIQSALAQAGVDLEVIVVDDASTDDTCETVLRLAAVDDRVRLVSLSANGGPSAARNAGLDAARGDWIAVLDADDAFEPGRLARLISIATKKCADLIADNFRYFDARTMTPGPAALQESGEIELLDRYRFLTGARPYGDEADYGLLKPVFRHDFLAEHGISYPLHSRHGEDFLLYLDCLLRGGRFLLVREPGYLYTTRTSGLSRTAIDYSGQLQQLAVLAMQPGIAGDSKMLTLLEARGAALRRLEAERRLQGIVQRKDLGALLTFAARPSGAALTGRWVLRAMRRKWRVLAGRAAAAG